jgi:hypothetical protein
MELLMMLLRASWRVFIVAIHLIFIVVASYLAFWLRYDGMIPDWALALFAKWLPVLIAMRGLALVPFGVFDGIWRSVFRRSRSSPGRRRRSAARPWPGRGTEMPPPRGSLSRTRG